MIPQRKLLQEYKDVLFLDFIKKERKEVNVAVFTDCIVTFQPSSFYSKEKYYTHVLFNELSYAIEMENMKYYKNIIKVVGRKSKITLMTKTEEEKGKFLSLKFRPNY